VENMDNRSEWSVVEVHGITLIDVEGGDRVCIRMLWALHNEYS